MKSRVLFLIVLMIFVDQIMTSTDNSCLTESSSIERIEVRDGAEIFYLLVKSKSNPQTDPLIIWISGGPGISFLKAILTESGPLLLQADSKLKINLHSWTFAANVLYVDQPVGTGFSQADPSKIPISLSEISNDFIQFLLKFFEKNQNYKNRQLFLAGNSFAGQYIPVFANDMISLTSIDYFHLVGIYLGNALVDPYYQFGEYLTFAKENEIHFTEEEEDQYQRYIDTCRNYMISRSFNASSNICLEPIIAFFDQIQIKNKINLFDIRIEPTQENPIRDLVNNFANCPIALRCLGISNLNWQYSSDAVNSIVQSQNWKNNSPLVSSLLNKGIRLLIVHGDKDFKCNWRGGEKWTNEINWNYQKEFNETPYRIWKNYGQFKTVENLTFMRVFDVGHNVLRENQELSKKMINALLKGQNLNQSGDI